MKEKFHRLRFHFGPPPNRHIKTKQMIYKLRAFIKTGNIIRTLEIWNRGGSGIRIESGLWEALNTVFKNSVSNKRSMTEYTVLINEKAKIPRWHAVGKFIPQGHGRGLMNGSDATQLIIYKFNSNWKRHQHSFFFMFNTVNLLALKQYIRLYEVPK